MHQPLEENNTPDDEVFSINLDMLGGMLPAFPEWFRKFYNILMIHGYANLGMFYNSLRKEEVENMLAVFRLANQSDRVACKNIMLFTAMNMLASGESILSNHSLYSNHLKVAVMVVATYLHKTGKATAHYDKFNFHTDVNTYVTLNKPLDPEVQNAS